MPAPKSPSGPAQAHLPFLLEGRLHLGGLEDPVGRARRGEEKAELEPLAFLPFLLTGTNPGSSPISTKWGQRVGGQSSVRHPQSAGWRPTAPTPDAPELCPQATYLGTRITLLSGGGQALPGDPVGNKSKP